MSEPMLVLKVHGVQSPEHHPKSIIFQAVQLVRKLKLSVGVLLVLEGPDGEALHVPVDADTDPGQAYEEFFGEEEMESPAPDAGQLAALRAMKPLPVPGKG